MVSAVCAISFVNQAVFGQVLGAWHDPSKHQIQFITVEDGVRLEVLDWGGTGRAVVLLPGLGFTAHVFDGFAEKLAQNCHVYGITRRGYGASTRPASGYSQDRLAQDDLRVFDALKLAAPIVAGHSISGNEMSQLGIHYYERIGGLVYLDALNDSGDDWADYDALEAKLPEAVKKPPSRLPSDLKSFAAYRDWRARTQGVAIPEAEFRNDFAENPDGSVGDRITPAFVPQAIMAGGGAHDYSQIRVPVLAFIGYPPLPQDQIRENHITDANELMVVYAVFGSNVGMIRKRIKRIENAAGGARVVDLWGANHFVFLSNEADVSAAQRLHQFSDSSRRRFRQRSAARPSQHAAAKSGDCLSKDALSNPCWLRIDGECAASFLKITSNCCIKCYLAGSSVAICCFTSSKLGPGGK